MTSSQKQDRPSLKVRKLFRYIGPGLITGAADDDPSGIATYTQTGAQFGFGQLWTVIFMLPLMIAVQEACARIGAVNGKGIVAVLKQYYDKKIVYAAVLLIFIANTINIGADIGAMAAAAQLIFPLSFVALTLIFTAIILTLEIFTSYKLYAKVLKWLALALLSYPLTLLIISLPWHEVIRATFIPHIELNFTFLFIITGVVGTTISPYMFFWQASEEVEEEKSRRLLRKDKLPVLPQRFIHDLRIDNAMGMISSQVATWCVIVVSAAVLHVHGVTDVRTAADAARALEPLVQTFPYSGFLAKSIFAIGIIGLGLLAVPVLSGSASYALCDALNWKEGLNLKLKTAHGFYGAITIATVVGLLINFVGIDPIKALVFTAVFNGVTAVPLLFLIARVSSNQKIMGKYVNGPISSLLLWLTFFAMGAAAVAMIITTISTK